MWRGAGRGGSGALTSESGVLSNTPHSFKTCFENEKSTNPEELIATARTGLLHDGARLSATGGSRRRNCRPRRPVGIEKEGAGFRIARSALALPAKTPAPANSSFRSWGARYGIPAPSPNC